MAHTELGIVSPCSTCKNQRASSIVGGAMNYCPRRRWQNQYVTEIAGTPDQQVDASNIEQLALTGNDSDPSTTAQLNNPVYDIDNQSILVWIALYTTNRAIRSPGSGIIVNPGLSEGLDVFDTEYIQCESMPYTPNIDEHGYFMNGALKEGDPIQVSKNMDQFVPGGSEFKPISGSVQRSSIAGTIPRNPTLSDNSPSGT
jgi:hypothetical protein